MKPKQKKLLIVAILIIGIAAALYILKPTGNVGLPQTLDPEPEDDMAAALEDIKPEQLILKEDDHHEEDVVEVNAGEEAQPASVDGKIDAKSGFRFEDRYNTHGDNAVVRTSVNGRINIALLKQDLPLINADFSNAMAVSFYSLKKIYKFLLAQSEFPEPAKKKLHGVAAEIIGTVMPIDPVAENGTMRRFWLANPVVVMAGCVFCNPPTMADLIYVEIPEDKKPMKVDREQLYKDIVLIKLKGRFLLGPEKTKDNVEYLYKIEFKEREALN